MTSAPQKLEQALAEWLVKNQLDMDTHFYNIDAWRARGELYLNSAELVLIFEGDLYTLMNYSVTDELHEEFNHFVESLGYWYELGHAWNMGFYPIEM